MTGIARALNLQTVSLGGRPVRGFALGDPSPAGAEVTATPAIAALAVGATAGLLANLLKAPLWGAILAGAGAAVTTKFTIDRAAGGA